MCWVWSSNLNSSWRDNGTGFYSPVGLLYGSLGILPASRLAKVQQAQTSSGSIPVIIGHMLKLLYSWDYDFLEGFLAQAQWALFCALPFSNMDDDLH